MNANELKCLLIDYLLKKYPDCLLIGSEVPYISQKRWVDILLITKKYELIAFEIKSDLDTLNRLEGQINDAIKTFNQVYIVFSSKFKDKKTYPFSFKNIGYLYVDKAEQKIIKESKTITRLSKINLSYFLWKKDLKKYFNDESISVDQMRIKFIKRRSINDIKELVIKALLSRYQNRFSLFLKYRDQNKTTLEDLDCLTKSSDSPL